MEVDPNHYCVVVAAERRGDESSCVLLAGPDTSHMQRVDSSKLTELVAAAVLGVIGNQPES